ncbi:uncharacterized protein LOC110442190 [Mizuhopecten yessoensis]|uniref:Uncharacterized protein n=1 Tax=Mizuhopecten yessoensis TaxID=6573 RepID=A0A210PHR9_MIZYE|nr:uncharacterized protein LOC110442190 [Mizuhopecten yessoensis]OWF36038.1 hypothetical protein KP79_PYT24188 [Mizuhopecten yessoensis]
MADTGPVRERMHFEEKANRNNQCTGSCTQGINKLLLVLVVCLAVVTLIVIAILIWRENKDDRRISRNNLNKFYPGYFRTKAEQLEFANKSVIYVPVKETFTSPLSCGLECLPNVIIYNSTTTPGPVNRGRRSAPDITYNGCCQSNTFFISPVFKINLFGVSREFVSLQNARQFFQTGSCQFAIGCTGCTCMMSQEIDTAVVYKPGENGDTADDIDDTEIDTFYFEKCCKCINVGT